jgi:hypothetical protein
MITLRDQRSNFNPYLPFSHDGKILRMKRGNEVEETKGR